MWVHFVSTWIHVTPVPDHAVKMVAFVKLITLLRCQRSSVDAQLDSRLRCVKSPNGMPANRIHVKMVDRAIWNHCRTMCVRVHKAIPVSYNTANFWTFNQIKSIIRIFKFAGKFCEKQNLCASSPCDNGGTCISLPGGDFKCHCPKGFQGKTCSDDVEECNTMPCHHGGTCRNTLGSYQ